MFTPQIKHELGNTNAERQTYLYLKWVERSIVSTKEQTNIVNSLLGVRCIAENGCWPSIGCLADKLMTAWPLFKLPLSEEPCRCSLNLYLCCPAPTQTI